MAVNVKTPYDSARRLINTAGMPSWMNEYDAIRYASYDLYESIYWTEPDTFKLQQRGTKENALYIPSGRIITNTMDRYVARDFKCIMDPAFGSANEQTVAALAFNDLFKRERFGSGFENAKLWGLMRGDWLFYVTANPAKPQGSRLSLRPLDPREYFPINPERDVERLIGCDIVEQVVVGEDTLINRVRYLKPEHPDHPQTGNLAAPISFQIDRLEVENWENPDEQKIVQSIQPVVLMPKEITSLPIYHIKNQEQPANPFGSSEMRGLERVMAGINQSIDDEELTLALHGLGMYKSEKGQPVDANGNPTAWQLGPGRVVHDASFDRVNGVSSVEPFLDHIQYLESRMNEVSGSSDVARGKVDVSVAESGIALRLKLGPIIDASKKKDIGIVEVMDNLFFDLRNWFKAYEGIDMTNVRPISSIGDKIPQDKAARFSELLQMVSSTPPLITMGYFRDAVRELGIPIPTEVTLEQIALEQAAYLLVADPYAGRIAEEGGDPEEGEEVPDPAGAGV